VYVCPNFIQRDGVLGVRATFRKRYITLAPVAGVVGIGIDLQDPKGLLKKKGNTGFTVALLERDHEGLRMGPRHSPLVSAFMNGTVEGDDVWIPMDSILGGQEKCGFGWHMFVECLAEGRGVSLPSGAVTAGRLCSGGVGAYARVRKQFKVRLCIRNHLTLFLHMCVCFFSVVVVVVVVFFYFLNH
jgi:acyl-CoA dehydrogenase